MAKKASASASVSKAASKASPAESERAGFIDPSRYTRTTFTDPKTGKPRHSAGNGDAVATALLHVPNEKLDTVARKNGIEGFVGKEFVNPGQRRMALGNRLRAAVRRCEAKEGEPVTIGEHEIKKLDQRVPLPEASLKAREKAVKDGARKAKKKVAETSNEEMQAAE